MKQTQVLSDHLNHIYASEQKLHELIPNALKKTNDVDVQTAFTELLNFTLENSKRMGRVSQILDTELKTQTPKTSQALIKELQKRVEKAQSLAEQMELLEILHKYLGNLFTDYTYTLNLMSDTDQHSEEATSLLQESIDELKECNDQLSKLALQKISHGKRRGWDKQQKSRPQKGQQGGMSERQADKKQEQQRQDQKPSFGQRLKNAYHALQGK